ncbi:MAG: PKD domain-containing protein [Chloroflexi bacterium]|nr:PKD domain-containing protein [Chloroflexota bacterium]
MKQSIRLVSLACAVFVLFSFFPPLLDHAVAQGPVAPSKISSRLDMQLKEKAVYIARGGRMQPEEVTLPQLIGRPLEEASRQKVFIHSAERPGPAQLAELRAMGIAVYPDSWIPPVGRHPTGFFYAESPVDQIQVLAARDYVSRVETAEMASKPLNDLAAQATGANQVWNLGYRGAGVTVAVLDSGLDTNHLDFPVPVVKKDYSAYPVVDETVANTVTGHGTHVAGTAVGRGTRSGGTYKGAAPEASLVFIKIGRDSDSAAPSAGEVAAIRDAVDLYGARVITMSYGSWSDYHDGSGSVAQAVDYAVSRGAVYFGSAGNSANDGEHYSGTVSAGGTTGFVQVNATNTSGTSATNTTVLSFNMVWFDGPGIRNDLVLEYYDSAFQLLASTNGTQSQGSRGTESEVSRMNGWLPYLPSLATSTWYVRVRNNSATDQLFHLYYDDYYNSSSAVRVTFQTPDPFYTLSSPAEADGAIAVGAYVTRKIWTDYQGGMWQSSETVGTIASFSSRGPRVDGGAPGAPGKPNLVAPGSRIVSARDAVVYPWPNTNYNRYVIDNDGQFLNGSGPADYYLMQGTSMAAPHAAGIAALLLSKNPSLTPAQVRTYLESTATDKGDPGRDNTYGWGLINALAAINQVPAAVPPVAGFTRVLNPANGVAPVTANFTDTSTNSPTSWSWNFGDGSGSSSQNPSKTYSTPGNYTVTLTAGNIAGSSSASQTVNIYSIPVAGFTRTLNPANGVAPASATFTDSSTGNVTTWSWSFGDGTGSSSQNAVKIYSAGGNYTVTLTASNPAGSRSTSQIVSVYGAPVAGFSKSASIGLVPLTVNFADTSSGNVTGWSWNFGDGAGSSSQNPSRTYASSGNYTVTLTATNPAGSNSTSQAIAVYNLPVAGFTKSLSPGNGVAPVTVSFTDTSTGTPVTWSWDFGDGTGSSSQNPVKIYSAAGNHTVTLTVTNPPGGVGSVSQAVSVYSMPVAGFTENVSSGIAPLTVNFTDTSAGNIVSWLWSFGDGTTSSTKNPVKTYSSSGNYAVTLTVTNPAGSSSATAVKRVYSMPSANFTVSATGANPGGVLYFTDQSSGNVTGWSWSFGDGTGSSSQNPSKSYASTGNYSVSLTASNLAGSNTLSRTGYVTVTSSALSLTAETALVPDVSGGYAVIRARINRLKNGAEVFAIGDGIGSYDAYVTYVAAGVTVVGVDIEAPFGSPTVTAGTGRTDFNASQAGGSPAPMLDVARLRVRLPGSSEFPYTVTLNFNSIARVSGGGTVEQAGPAGAVFRRGDANGNGVVDMTDALFIAQYRVGIRGLGTDALSVNPVSAASVKPDDDGTGDKIDMNDALFIAQFRVGIRNASFQWTA